MVYEICLMTSFWCLYCQISTEFRNYSGIFIVDFEQVNSSWVTSIQQTILCFRVTIKLPDELFNMFKVMTKSPGETKMRSFRCLYWELITHQPNQLPANIYLFKVNNKNTRKRCEICSQLTIKTPDRRH